MAMTMIQKHPVEHRNISDTLTCCVATVWKWFSCCLHKTNCGRAYNAPFN